MGAGVMRRRLLISMLSVAIVAVVALGVPLGFVLGRLQVNEANQTLRRDATTLAKELQDRFGESPGLPVQAAQLARPLTDRFVLIFQNGNLISHTGVRPPRRSSRSVTVVTRTFRVYVAADDEVLTGNLTKELLLVGVVALLAVGIAAVLGLTYARRIIVPLQELAGAADRLGSGDSSPLGRRYGIHELDRVAEGLDGSAQRINDLLSAERDFAV